MKPTPANYLKIIAVLLMLLVGWNYWLPAAIDFYNYVTKNDDSSPGLQNVDFYAYYNAGGRIDRGENPYYWGQDAQGKPVISDYLYPPTVLPLFQLLSQLPYDQARLLWLVLYALSYLSLLGWMYRSFMKDWRDWFALLGMLLTLASYPLLSHVLHGQAEFFIISLILASYLTYTRGHRLGAAILLAMATVLKVSPVFLLIYFVVFLRDYRFLLMYIGAGLVIFAVSLIFVPFSFYPDYIFHVLPEISKGSSFWLNQSVTKYLTFSPLLARIVSFGGLGLLTGLVWYIGRCTPLEQRKPVLPLGENGFISEAVFILNLAGILVFVSVAWAAAYVWLILPSAWLITGLIRQQVKAAYLVGAILGVFLVIAKDYGYPIVTSMNLWGGLTLSICLVIGLLQKRISSNPQ